MSELRRHTRHVPCPVCGGGSDLPHGKGIRCAGFSLDAVAYCTREERAGGLELDMRESPPAYKHLLYGECRCGRRHGTDRRPAPIAHAATASGPTPDRLDVEERHTIYSAALALLDVRRGTHDDLRRRGLGDETIADVGYRSIPLKGNAQTALMAAMRERFGDSTLLRCPGFHDKNGRLTFACAVGKRDGYVVPYRDERGRVTGFQVRLFVGGYQTPAGTKVAEIYHVARSGRETGDLYLTEGGLKSQVASSVGGIWCMGIPGQALQGAHIEVIRRLEPRRVIVAFDQEPNDQTRQVTLRCCDLLWDAGLPVYSSKWEGVL
ncbi:hypothetical protein J0H33_05935 [bacterium]|nr:hypothetical protein [bacterium]